MDRPLILVLEDKLSLNYDLLKHLSHHGFKVVRSGSGTEAVDLLQDTCPDLAIITANHSSRGVETVKLLRRHSRGTPVILIVKESSESRAIVALRAEINDYFKHPVSFKELLESIRRHLPGTGAECSGNQPAPQAGEAEPVFIGATARILKIKRYRQGRRHGLQCPDHRRDRHRQGKGR